MVSPMSLESCVSVSVVELASGGSATKGVNLSSFYISIQHYSVDLSGVLVLSLSQ